MENEPVVIETPNHLIALAIEKQADPNTLSKLMDLQERWEAGQAKKAFVKAMTAFKVEAPAVLKKSDRVDFSTAKGRTTYNYANLGSIVQEITAILGKHELSASWGTSQDGPNVTVTCHVTHIAGHRESVTLTGPIDESGNKNRIQAVGSTVTYLQRYTLLAALGLATGEDDDGYGGEKKPPVKTAKQEFPPPETDPDRMGPEALKLAQLLMEKYDKDKPKMAYALSVLTTWDDKDGKHHDGMTTLKGISEKMAQVTRHKYEAWLKKQAGCPANDAECDRSSYGDQTFALCEGLPCIHHKPKE